MEAFEIALLSVIAMLVFIYLGMHIAVTLALVSFVGTWIIKGNSVVAINLLWISSHQTVNNFVFAVIPLFVLMGFLVSVAGMGRDAYEIGQLMLRRVRGGLRHIRCHHRRVGRFRLRVFQDRRTGDDAPRLYRPLCGWHRGRLVGAGDADPSKRITNHLRPYR